MREKFTENLPSVPIHDGTSTSIPFPDGYFQIVFVAQAFHWFANVESLKEIDRVLCKNDKSNGTKTGLVLIWNMEDRNKEDYIGELRDLYEKFDENVPQYRKNAWKPVIESNTFFQVQESEFFQASRYMSKSLVWSRILSKSYIASLDGESQAKLKAQVDAVLEKYSHRFLTQSPELNCVMDSKEDPLIHFPHVTELVMGFKNQ
jgi:hypothetical protein